MGRETYLHGADSQDQIRPLDRFLHIRVGCITCVHPAIQRTSFIDSALAHRSHKDRKLCLLHQLVHFAHHLVANGAGIHENNDAVGRVEGREDALDYKFLSFGVVGRLG